MAVDLRDYIYEFSFYIAGVFSLHFLASWFLEFSPCGISRLDRTGMLFGLCADTACQHSILGQNQSAKITENLYFNLSLCSHKNLMTT